MDDAACELASEELAELEADELAALADDELALLCDAADEELDDAVETLLVGFSTKNAMPTMASAQMTARMMPGAIERRLGIAPYMAFG